MRQGAVSSTQRVQARRSRLIAALLTVMMVSGVATSAANTPELAVAGETAGNATGVVDTIVGPGVCPHGGRVAETAQHVRSVAVGSEGTVFFDTGMSGVGEVAAVDARGRGRLLRIGITADPVMLSAGGTGGLLVAAEDRVEWLGEQGMLTVAGDRLDGTEPAGSGDGGPAGQARFAGITAIASDADGNVYLADAREDDDGDPRSVAIRVVNLGEEPASFYGGTDAEITLDADHIDTVVGGEGADAHGDRAGDRRPTRLPRLAGQVTALAVVEDRLYVAVSDDSQQPTTSTVHIVNLGTDPIEAHGVEVAAGEIAIVAGGGPAGFAGEGELALDAQFGKLTGLAGDADGHLYVADRDHHRIRRVDAAGAVSTFAGTGTVDEGGFNGNNQLATDARLDSPHDVAVSPDSRVFIADAGNGQLRVVDDAGLIQPARGNGLARMWQCADGDGELRAARDSHPADTGPLRVAAADEEVYFTAASLPAVYRTDGDGEVTVAVGDPDNPACPDDVPCPTDDIALHETPLSEPQALAADGKGGLYLLDVADGGRLWLANLSSDPHPAHGQTLPAHTARIVAADVLDDDADTAVIDVDEHGRIYLADGHKVGRLDRDDSTTVLDRLDTDDLDRVVGPPDRCCAEPTGLASIPGGGLYVADTFAGGRVWLLNPTSEALTAHGHRLGPDETALVAGVDTPLSERDGDRGDGGPATEAELGEPRGLTLDGSGRLHLVDADEHTVRTIDPNGTITTTAGTGSATFNGDQFPAGVTSLAGPTDLAVDDCDNLLIADTANQRLRHADIAGPCPNPAAEHADYEPTGNSITTILLAAVGIALAAALLGGAVATRRQR